MDGLSHIETVPADMWDVQIQRGEMASLAPKAPWVNKKVPASGEKSQSTPSWYRRLWEKLNG